MLTEPLLADAEMGPCQLTGSVSADQTLALTGSVRLTPAAVAEASRGNLVPYGPVPRDAANQRDHQRAARQAGQHTVDAARDVGAPGSMESAYRFGTRSATKLAMRRIP